MIQPSFVTETQPNLLEWLETNGLGGWASSTVCGANTRSYHGILVAEHGSSAERFVYLSRLDETLAGVDLATSFFPGAIHPQGFRFIESFSRKPRPSWIFNLNGVRLKKELWSVYGENTVVVSYQSSHDVELCLKPFLGFRSYHATGGQGASFQFKSGELICTPSNGLATLKISAPGALFLADPDWYHNFLLLEESSRGLNDKEDLFTPGKIKVALKAQTPLLVTISLAEPAKEPRVRSHSSDPDPFVAALKEAVDHFIIRRPDGRTTIIAGYHWFTDWGRDTMIALPGACLINGRFREARDILLGFASYIRSGLIPNRFPDSGTEPEYHSVDGSLWFVIAVHQYLTYTDDDQFRKQITPIVLDIIKNYRAGTLYSIHERSDGLILCGNSNTSLTWMDARVDGSPVTSRDGAPVEINALWYNVQRIAHLLDPHYPIELADKTRRAFISNFITPEGYLYDRLATDGPDPTVRPNQILALSLPFPLLDKMQSLLVLETVRRELLTPYGLRSLSRHDSRYRGRYEGSPKVRDAAYHQGTVWPWLLGPYMIAVKRFEPAWSPDLTAIKALLEERGSIAEILDGDPPHTPRGCIAQAWSVAEILRGYVS